jgi:hypothetical protein
MYYCIKYRSCLEPLLHIYLLLVQQIYLESYLCLGSNTCLAMLRPVEVGRFPVTCKIGSIWSRLAIFAIVEITMC